MEALGAARSIGGRIDGPLRAALVAPFPTDLGADLNREGVDEVLLVPVVDEHPDADTYQQAVGELIKHCEPTLVLSPFSADAKGYGPGLAVELDLGFATDVTGIEVVDGRMTASRPMYGGAVEATLSFEDKPRALMMISPGHFPLAEGSGEASIRVFSEPRRNCRTKDLGFERIATASKAVEPGEKRLALSIGPEADAAGLTGRFEELGSKLDLVRARRGASVDWPADSIHLAIGSPEAPVGSRDSSLLIAVCADPCAPILGKADLGAVADLDEFAAALERHLAGR